MTFAVSSEFGVGIVAVVAVVVVVFTLILMTPVSRRKSSGALPFTPGLVQSQTTLTNPTAAVTK